MKICGFYLACLFTITPSAHAGLNSAVIVLPGDNLRSAPAATIIQPADYLCALVTLRSTARDPDRQTTAMREILQRVTTAVEQSSHFQLHQGAVRFAGNATSLYNSANGPAALQTSVRVLAPLVGTADVFETMRQLRRFVGTLPAADGAESSLASISLAVAAPEAYRDRLLALIAEQSRVIQRNFGARTIIIDGLQNPISVRQIDELNIELSLDYQLSATLENR